MNTRTPVEHLVVVGAGLAGLRAIEGARSTGWRGRITLVGEEMMPPYDRPPLSKAFLTVGHLDSVAPFRREQQLQAELGVEALLGARAAALDVEGRRLHVEDGRTLRFDSLVVTTGARARTLPGQQMLEQVTCLRTADDARRVRVGLENGGPVVVVGGGFIGSEVASAARERGLEVTIVDSEPVPLARSLGPHMGAMCAGLHEAAGTELRLGVGVDGFVSTNGSLDGVRLSDGEVIPACLVVVGIGAAPATDWLQGSGVALHDRDSGVVCDGHLATSAPGVWAAGDVAWAPYALFDNDLMRVEHWTNAAEQGALAAANAVLDGDAIPHAVRGIPYFWSDWYGHRIQFVGTPAADEVVAVGPSGPGVIALFRRGDRLVGTCTIDRGGDIMKFRRRIAEHGAWAEALGYAEERSARFAVS
jgi:NADPH-dependent 2,4-dienoyl-CoA reductase/sulfur reductase-like enzyme